MRTYTVIAVNPLEQCSRDDKPAGMLFQYDYGQRLVFGGVDLPSAYEVHFSNDREGESVTVIGDVTGVDIPDSLLLTGQDIHVWLYLHQGEGDGETVYYARIAVRTRATPTHEEPTPVQQDEITQAIAALNAAVESTEADAAAAEASASAASAAQAAAEAAQDGAESAMSAAEAAQTGAETAEEAAEDAQAAAERARDEITGMTAEATTLDPGESATASYEDGVLTIGVPRGADGQDGDPGEDGYSPSASVSKSGTTATITITDKNGTTTAEVSDGEDGAPGADGISPTASVSKSGTTATITITDKDGTTTATVSDGENGQDGYTPQRGTDYWTEADKAEIVSDTAEELMSEIDGKAPAIFRDASGDIASFSDGADGMPLSAMAQIDPVQDTSGGDPSPSNVCPITGHTGAQIYRSGADTSDPTVYAIDWQTAAGTVYGGYFDTKTGVLTVDRGIVTYTGASGENWTQNGSTSFYIAPPTAYRGISQTPITDYLKSYAPGQSSGLTDWSCRINATYAYFNVRPDMTVYDTVEKWTAYLAEHPLTVLYTLVEPLTYQLDPVQITTLMGENHLWADTGAIAVTYPADTQTYVDSAISAATDPDGNVISVTGSTPTIVGESGRRYVCGTVDSISITPPQTGIIDVVFTSGTTPTVLTVPNTVQWPWYFDPTALEASTKYEINIMDGTDGAVMAWT